MNGKILVTSLESELEEKNIHQYMYNSGIIETAFIPWLDHRCYHS